MLIYRFVTRYLGRLVLDKYERHLGQGFFIQPTAVYPGIRQLFRRKRAFSSTRNCWITTWVCCGAYTINQVCNTFNFSAQMHTSVLKHQYHEYNRLRLGITKDNPTYSGYFLKNYRWRINWFGYGTLPDSTTYLTGSFFLNQTTGFVLSDSLEHAGILKTTDGGLSWRNVTPRSDVTHLAGIIFSSAMNGVAVGYYSIQTIIAGIVLATSDGGENWQRIEDNSIDNFTSVASADSQTFFAAGVTSGNTIVRMKA